MSSNLEIGQRIFYILTRIVIKFDSPLLQQLINYQN